MASVTVSSEMGANQVKGLGFIGMEDIEKELKKYADKIEDDIIKEAIRAAAEVFKDALTKATPTGETSYTRNRKRHHPGTAKKSVIIYKRKQPRGVLAISNLDLALLVGYAKKQAFYMYWYVKGRRKQGVPAIDSELVKRVYEANYRNAMKAAEEVIKRRLG